MAAWFILIGILLPVALLLQLAEARISEPKRRRLASPSGPEDRH